MHDIIIHAAHMSSMNNRYHHITLQSTSLLTYTYIIQRSHVCDHITSYNGSKLGLSTDKFNKWLREALYTNMPFHEGPDCCLGLCYQGPRRTSVEDSIGVRVLS